MYNRKEVNSKESNTPLIDSMQILKEVFIKNTKLIKDSIDRSIASNIPLVKLFFIFLFNFN